MSNDHNQASDKIKRPSETGTESTFGETQNHTHSVPEKSHGQATNGKDYSSASSISSEKGDPDNPKPYTENDIELGPLHNYNDIIAHNQGDRLSRIESNPALSRELTRKMLNMPESVQGAYDEDVARAWGDKRPFPPPLPDKDAYCVTFTGPDDPYSPRNYPASKKFLYCFTAGFSAMYVSLGSAYFSQGNKDVMETYHVGETVAALATSLYVMGFAIGPIVYGPLSELYGRKPIMVFSALGYSAFLFGVAAAKDLQTIMLCRFFAGFIGSGPFPLAPAIMVDLLEDRPRSVAVNIFVGTIFGAPMLGPILGGFTTKNSALGWRWNSYFSAIIGCVALILNVFCLEETHHPIILAKRAEELRRKSGNWGIFAPYEELSLSLKEIARNSLLRPWELLFLEPIVLLMCLYNAFIYGMLYSFLTVIPLIFEGRFHWSQGVAELPYISMMIGVAIAGFGIIMFERWYNNKLDTTDAAWNPESCRLPPVMVGGFIFVIGIFWLGWTGDYPEHIHWIVPVIGACFVGIGLILIFLPTLNYLIDCYVHVPASILAANTFMRASFGAAFPLFDQQMFTNLTIKWAATLIGCLAALMIPVPFIFYKYGAYIRSKSKYALK
ncbi:hypothetical protein KGF57_003491 [Candida theae]|uniref:Major facilitator superfamily (MFS) profile domain-containing protein n=1 Tax=Candida theae TaxID=1198502 RepID=A0AAD5BDD9_9ASCO|nr:uncharacterized protein KGF57_003491 [Candida theae]KAI5956005.1 hypothetical protein KGF57_003491 [Candida theae]